MRDNSPVKNKGNILIGLVLCLVCVAFLVITILAICETFSEKARLESIGATVTLRITWLFIVDIAAIIASGILGMIFLFKRSTALNPVSDDGLHQDKKDEEINPPDENDFSSTVDEVGYDLEAINRFKTEDIVVKEDTLPVVTTETTYKPSKLKIKMGNSSFSERISEPTHSKSEELVSQDNKSSELSSGFFSAGDDL